MIPLNVWLGIFIAAFIAITTFAGGMKVYRMGKASVQAEWDLERERTKIEIEKLKSRQAQTTERVVTQWKTVDRIVKEKGDEVVKLVTVYVPGGNALPSGWRVYHDAAASGELPESPERAIAAAAPVEAAAAAATVAENYTTCRATREQLLALQKWSTEISKGGSP